MTLIAMLSSAHTARRLCGIFLMAAASSGCSKESESKEAHLARAKQYLADAQYDKAETEYRDVLRLDAADAVALRDLAHHVPGAGPIAAGLSGCSRKLRNCCRTIPICNSSSAKTSWCRANIRRRERRLCARSTSSPESRRRSC